MPKMERLLDVLQVSFITSDFDISGNFFFDLGLTFKVRAGTRPGKTTRTDHFVVVKLFTFSTKSLPAV